MTQHWHINATKIEPLWICVFKAPILMSDNVLLRNPQSLHKDYYILLYEMIYKEELTDKS